MIEESTYSTRTGQNKDFHMSIRLSSMEWREQALRLHHKGVGPLSISVRLGIPWKTVVQFLEEQKKISTEIYDKHGKIYHSNER